MTTTENNVAAQAGDETAALAKQLATWRAEVARLNDLIAHASGVQAGDEPMREAFEAHIRSLNPKQLFVARWPDGSYMHHGTDGMWSGWQAAMSTQVSPRATADVEREVYLLWNEDRQGGEWVECSSSDPAAIKFVATTKPGA